VVRDAASAVRLLREYEVHVARWREAGSTFSASKLAAKQQHVRGLVAAAKQKKLDANDASLIARVERQTLALLASMCSQAPRLRQGAGDAPTPPVRAAGKNALGQAPSPRVAPTAKKPRKKPTPPRARIDGTRAGAQSGDGVRHAGGSRDHIAAHLSREGQIEDGVAQGWRDVDPNQGHPIFDDWSAVVDDGLHDI
jgi:hypothetical protein